MNICDENIDFRQVELLRSWGVRISQIGPDISRKGIQDDEIVPMLHRLHRPTLFICDSDFYKRELCHPKYCLVQLDISQRDVAVFIQRILSEKRFGTWALRQGRVIQYGYEGVRYWQFKVQQEHRSKW